MHVGQPRCPALPLLLGPLTIRLLENGERLVDFLVVWVASEFLGELLDDTFSLAFLFSSHNVPSGP